MSVATASPNKRVSGFAIAPPKFPPLRSGTSDMPKTIEEHELIEN